MARLKIFFDGGCRPNPGHMEAAVVMRGVVHRFDDLGMGTNEDAEWLALIGALRLAQLQALREFVLIGDAVGIIRQANRALLNADGLTVHAASFAAMAADGPTPQVRWIKRAQNLAGIALAAEHAR